MKCEGCNKAVEPLNYIRVGGKVFHDERCLSKYMARPGGKRIT